MKRRRTQFRRRNWCNEILLNISIQLNIPNCNCTVRNYGIANSIAWKYNKSPMSVCNIILVSLLINFIYFKIIFFFLHILHISIKSNSHSTEEHLMSDKNNMVKWLLMHVFETVLGFVRVDKLN